MLETSFMRLSTTLKYEVAKWPTVKNKFMPWLTMFILHWSTLKRNFQQTNPCAGFFIFFFYFNMDAKTKLPLQFNFQISESVER